MLKEPYKKIIEARQYDPFSVLGMHLVCPAEGTPSLEVRAFIPTAESVCVLSRKDPQIQFPMEKIHKSGFFEVVIHGYTEVFPYMLKVKRTWGVEEVIHDPYSFLPVLTEFDQHLFNEGNHFRIYDKMGAHPLTIDGVKGVHFAVWAPNAERVSVVGDFNQWDGRVHSMRVLGSSGIWEIFIPGIEEGQPYKYEIRAKGGAILLKADPIGFYYEKRPKTASVIKNIEDYNWQDQRWIEQRPKTNWHESPVSIYEVHLGSWRHPEGHPGDFMTYRELAATLLPYARNMGYTHIELMPVSEHPLDQSWGYQVTGYFAPTSRYGTPEDFMYLVDQAHQFGLGVILDWVPAHFPKDGWALSNFDGTALYEHADPRMGEHKDWGTKIFNYGRNEVRSFLISNALYWLDKYHIDGLRVDAVASMLYLDYSRKQGEWIPNKFGGRENLDAIAFMKKMNEVVHHYFPGILTIAEESTSWDGVSRPTYLGGLGFSMKWNMGWMNDMLAYFSKDPIHRRFHHNNLTFAMIYAFHENFVLVLSHDEVVHGKSSLLAKMPGYDHDKFCNLRALYGYMYAQPGKKLLFMGGEFGQWHEWNCNVQLSWELLEYDKHRGLQNFVRDLNHLYKQNPALYELDTQPAGFEWIDFRDSDNSIVSFIRRTRKADDYLVMIFNFTPVPRIKYRVGVPETAFYEEVLNSDSDFYGGANIGNQGGIQAEAIPWSGRQASIEITLPPLSAVYFKPKRG